MLFMIYYIIFTKKKTNHNLCKMFETRKHLKEICTEKVKFNLSERIVTIDVYTEH